MINRLKGLISELNAYHFEEEQFEMEQKFINRLVIVSLIIGALASFFARTVMLGETWLPAGIDAMILLCFGIFHHSLNYIKNDVTKRLMAFITYNGLLVFMSYAFYNYIGPSIWVMGAVFVVMGILSSKRDMLIGFIIAIYIIGISVYLKAPDFQISLVYYFALLVAFSVFSVAAVIAQSVIKDRTDIYRRQYEKVVETEKQLYFTLNAIGDAVITTDEMGKITFANPVAEALTEYSVAELIDEVFGEKIDLIDEYTRDKVICPVAAVLEQKKVLQLSNHTLLVSKSGREISIEDTASPIYDGKGEFKGVVLIIRDHSYKKEKQRQIEYLSYHDQLSGLYNRRYYEMVLETIDNAENWPLAIMFVDVNGLKIINDAFGHQKGDELIKTVSEALLERKRKDDIIARIGGDEFVILMPRTEPTYIKHYIKEIEKHLRRVDIMGIRASVSFGWDIKRMADHAISETIKTAEDRMYQNKIYYSGSRRNDVIKSILNTLTLKSPREEAHSKRVSELCHEFGVALGLPESECNLLYIAGELHDIGKITLDETLLNKGEALSQKEWEKIKEHPEIGYRLLNTSKEFYALAEYVHAHHENWDGTGYPRGTKGMSIPLNARIICIVDAYDAMTTERPFKELMTKEEAIEELKACSGTQFDPELVRVFINHVLNESIK